MSEKSWIDEFYPVPADKVKGKITAIKHSLKKWEGLTKENLEKHNLSEPPIWVDSETCALCHLYFNESKYDIDESIACDSCPLKKSLGYPCDDNQQAEKFMSPYSVWRRQRNPEPMIEALRETLNENRRKS